MRRMLHFTSLPPSFLSSIHQSCRRCQVVIIHQETIHRNLYYSTYATRMVACYVASSLGCDVLGILPSKMFPFNSALNIEWGTPAGMLVVCGQYIFRLTSPDTLTLVWHCRNCHMLLSPGHFFTATLLPSVDGRTEIEPSWRIMCSQSYR